MCPERMAHSQERYCSGVSLEDTLCTPRQKRRKKIPRGTTCTPPVRVRPGISPKCKKCNRLHLLRLKTFQDRMVYRPRQILQKLRWNKYQQSTVCNPPGLHCSGICLKGKSCNLKRRLHRLHLKTSLESMACRPRQKLQKLRWNTCLLGTIHM